MIWLDNFHPLCYRIYGNDDWLDIKIGAGLLNFLPPYRCPKRDGISFITQMLLNVEFTCRNNNCFIQCCIDRMFSPPQGFQNLYSMSLRKILLMIFFLCPNKVIYDVILNLCQTWHCIAITSTNFKPKTQTQYYR